MSAQQDAAFAADLVRRHDFSRYAASLFVPPDKRRGLLALYAFNTEVSRVRELVSQPLPGEIRLRWWTDMLAGAGHGDVEGNPVAAELLWAIRTYELPVDGLLRLIDTHIFDLYNDPMPDLPVFESHIKDTWSTLLALAAQIVAGPAVSEVVGHCADHAGLAQGIARVAASLPYDAARRQLFMPLTFLTESGGSAEEVFAGRTTPAICAARDRLIAEARQHLDVAQEMLRELPVEARRVFLPLALAKRDLARLEDADPFAVYAPSRLSTLWTLWRTSNMKTFR
jgi:phytoene synthase